MRALCESGRDAAHPKRDEPAERPAVSEGRVAGFSELRPARSARGRVQRDVLALILLQTRIGRVLGLPYDITMLVTALWTSNVLD
jgi:hypothetical protein